MNKIISIPIHSFNDITTNSSSEIYLVKNNKIKEAVMDIVDALGNQFDMDVDNIDVMVVSDREEGCQTVHLGDCSAQYDYRYGDVVLLKGDDEAGIVNITKLLSKFLTINKSSHENQDT